MMFYESFRDSINLYYEKRGVSVSFYEFIQNLVGDQTPLGELAAWINQDAHFPIEETVADNILNYFNGLKDFDHELIEIVKRSLSLYEQSRM
jgi:hypothetical protein